ncbi:hypothetical protein HK100_012953 [Physocladia obscura]|uniref:Uncharacterized protein n=1 Tax=Physocladia obscura TaxID=109957 RepID=A0AAD5T1J3_9FUNG|nr:hypothetical protein HK100_012953 [Physocladia obscura]
MSHDFHSPNFVVSAWFMMGLTSNANNSKNYQEEIEEMELANSVFYEEINAVNDFVLRSTNPANLFAKPSQTNSDSEDDDSAEQIEQLNIVREFELSIKRVNVQIYRSNLRTAMPNNNSSSSNPKQTHNKRLDRVFSKAKGKPKPALKSRQKQGKPASRPPIKSLASELAQVEAVRIDNSNTDSYTLTTTSDFEQQLLVQSLSKARLSRTPPPPTPSKLKELESETVFTVDSSPFLSLSPYSQKTKNLNEQNNLLDLQSPIPPKIEKDLLLNELENCDSSVPNSPVRNSRNFALSHREVISETLESVVSSPISITFSESVAVSPQRENDNNTADYDAKKNLDEDFPLHTVSVQKESKAISPVASVSTIRNQLVPKFQEVDNNTETFSTKFDIELSENVEIPTPISPEKNQTILQVSTKMQNILSDTELPEVSKELLSLSNSENYTSNHDDNKVAQHHQENHVILAYQSSLKTSQRECAMLQDRIDKMQAEFEENLHKEIDEMEQEFMKKFQAYKNHYEDAINSEFLKRVQEMEQRRLVSENGNSHDTLVGELQREVDELLRERKKLEENLIKQILSILEQSNEERVSIHELLVEEKAKTARNEEEFRLFSKKMRNLQEINQSLKSENDKLRLELRKMQYENNTSTNEKEDYYKAKLDQARFDNESLRAVIASLTTQSNENYRSTSSQSEFSTHNRRSDSPAESYRKQPAVDYRSLPRSAELSSPLKQQLWTGRGTANTSHTMPRSTNLRDSVTPTDRDREKLLNKLRKYEAEDEDDNPSPESQLISPPFLRRTGGIQGGNTVWQRRDPNMSPTTEMNEFSGGRKGNDRNEVGLSEKGQVDFLAMRSELDSQLRMYTDKKSILMSELQRIPASSASFRRRKEQLEDELDAVEKAIGATKMKMRSFNLL